MTGKIIQVSGSVIDVKFEEGRLPKIKEALSVEVKGKKLIMEVSQHLGDKNVRCIMLAGSEGIARGMEVEASGNGITVPVGECTLGRMFNVVGEPIDGKGNIDEQNELVKLWFDYIKSEEGRADG